MISSLRLILSGAALDTGNRGVEALGLSVIEAIERRAEIDTGRVDYQLSVLDNGWGVRPDARRRYRYARVESVGVRMSRRWYRPESWAQVRLAQAVSSGLNPVARRLAHCDALLAMAGGDSFTDMYGPRRLKRVGMPMRAVLRAGRPLVFLPQTFGPFDTAEGRTQASELVGRASMAYARDAVSFGRLIELAGPGADVSLCRQGVDVAFALPPRRPVHNESIVEWVDRADGPTAGINVSGLLCLPGASERFGLVGDYLATMTDLVKGLVAQGASVLFVPHVHIPGGSGESDIAAIDGLRARLSASERERTFVVPADLDAAELKWCVATADWMVGSRMHATIAGLSQGIPTFGYAYSDKTAGVFETCGMKDQVADARQVSGVEAVARMVASFDGREETRTRLAAAAPEVVTTARRQLDDILTGVQQWGPERAPTIRGGARG